MFTKIHRRGLSGARALYFYLSATFALFLTLGTAVQADNIGVSFVGAEDWLTGGVGPTLAGTNGAGYVPQRFWNNAWNDTGSMSLQGDTNGPNAAVYANATVTWLAGSGDGYNLGQTSNTNSDGNSLMMRGYLVGQEGNSGALAPTVTVTVSNVPAALTNAGYAVVVYFDEGAAAVNELTVSATNYGTRSIYARDNGNVFSGTFTQVPSSSTSNLGSSTPAGNFAVFSGLTDGSFELTATPSAYGANAFINGFQIVPSSALPAPAVPVITSPDTATGSVNTAFRYTITASNFPYSYGAAGLPAGLALNSTSGVVSGTPAVAGVYDVTVAATNSSGVGTMPLTLTIGSGVAISNPGSGTTNTLAVGSLLNVNDGLISGDDGTLLTTTNGGQTWGMINVGLTNDLLAVQGIGGYDFVGGTFGLIAMSPDSGQTWTTFNLNLTNTFDSFSLLTPFWGYAVGSGGIVYFWNGVAWVSQASGTTANFYGVDDVDLNTAYAVGDGGTICRFNGTNWVVQTTGTMAVTFYGVDFLNEAFGYAVGSGGAIYQTHDGGADWVALNSGTSVTLRSIWVADLNTAWAVGDNGVFLQTTDGGAHWTQISLGTTVTLNSIEFLNGLGLICGGDGTVYLFQQAGYAVNESPVVSMVEPANAASICVCSETPISAAAYDPDGYITNLQLFFGSNELAQSAGNTVSYVWTNDSFLGTVTCVAKATDNLGATTFSAPVTFTIHLPATNQLVTLGLRPTNTFEFCAGGLSNRVYAVQTTTNMLTYWDSWKVITNLNGFVTVLDDGFSTNAEKFYRAGLATDLTLASGTISSTNVVAGNTLTASLAIANQACAGASVAAGPFHLAFYLADNLEFTNLVYLTEVSAAGCPANGTVSSDPSVTIPSTTTPGTYYLLFVINDQNEVPECDTDNNAWYWTITVQ